MDKIGINSSCLKACDNYNIFSFLGLGTILKKNTTPQKKKAMVEKTLCIYIQPIFFIKFIRVALIELESAKLVSVKLDNVNQLCTLQMIIAVILQRNSFLEEC